MVLGRAGTREISRAEFVALAAAIMAGDALAIDIMLPALPNIGEAFAVADPNDRSLVVIAFMLGFGLPQLFFGPISDRFGRRAPILLGLAAYVATALLAPFAPGFAALLGLRFLQGIAAAAVRVALFASIRDRYSGKAMSDVMSLVLAIFLLVPIFMPGVGQLILLVGPWELVFMVMGVLAAAVGAWTLIRLPESLAPQNRRALAMRSVGEAFAIVLTNRMALFYGLSGVFLFAVIITLVTTSQQIYVDIYGLGALFPLAFGMMGAVSAIASLLCPRVIGKLGMKKTAHGAIVIFIVESALWLALSLLDLMPLWLFLCFVAAIMPMIVANFSPTSALAMEPLGAVAGTASAIFGSAQVVGGALLGAIVAQSFDGTVVPIVAGVLVFTLCTLGCFLIAEKGRLFGSSPGGGAPKTFEPL
jgi:DHA1 family bicyclomycin/chloramphenicol resistance-like MFS transporter